MTSIQFLIDQAWDRGDFAIASTASQELKTAEAALSAERAAHETDVQTLRAERDEARRQLEQARFVMNYWLHTGRFLTANCEEDINAVQMLRNAIDGSALS
jgi:hypothetical protein